MPSRMDGCLIRQLPYIVEPLPEEIKSPASERMKAAASMSVTVETTSSNSSIRH